MNPAVLLAVESLRLALTGSQPAHAGRLAHGLVAWLNDDARTEAIAADYDRRKTSDPDHPGKVVARAEGLAEEYGLTVDDLPPNLRLTISGLVFGLVMADDAGGAACGGMENAVLALAAQTSVLEQLVAIISDRVSPEVTFADGLTTELVALNAAVALLRGGSADDLRQVFAKRLEEDPVLAFNTARPGYLSLDEAYGVLDAMMVALPGAAELELRVVDAFESGNLPERYLYAAGSMLADAIGMAQ